MTTPLVSPSNSLPWVEKYRPNTLSDLVAHTDIISILTRLTDANKLPHLLLYGPPGTGKTSTIVAMAKKMYGAKAYKGYVLELNASDDRGIDVVRNQIKDFASTTQLFSSNHLTKLIILDECDAMTSDAQFALRRIIEKYSEHVRFCLICNYVGKIIPALQSRCTRFRFAPLEKEQIRSRLVEVATAEKCDITPDGIEAILSLSSGDMRRVMNLLQSTHMSYSHISSTNVYLTSGAPLPENINVICKSVFNDNFNQACETLSKYVKEYGYALTDILTELTEYISASSFPDEILGVLLMDFATIEACLSKGGDDRLQGRAVVGAVFKAKGKMTPA
ncbi:hypothetical protein TrST_g651 [Triparma strigata]|uniref:AAA+ ATPase domain-containing protein n=1 Tax=Triparma strigata TaxID=1606541 RepID=A0A9W7AQJ8_9STRA|nr:hypothetical protein TrST_g651 [Triparma strigata]